MKKVIIAGSAMVLAFTGAVVSAQATQGGTAQMRPANQAEAIARADQRFQRLDTNHDGQLTQAELQAGKRGPGSKARMHQRGGKDAQQRVQNRGRHLERIDANGDGVITHAEFRAHAVERFAKWGSNRNGER